jgi:hypothetical protein
LFISSKKTEENLIYLKFNNTSKNVIKDYNAFLRLIKKTLNNLLNEDFKLNTKFIGHNVNGITNFEKVSKRNIIKKIEDLLHENHIVTILFYVEKRGDNSMIPTVTDLI